jgi:hypothetical protein
MKLRWPFAVGHSETTADPANSQRPAASGFALLALLALLLFARPLIRGEVFTFRDHSDYFQPLRYFTALELRQGRMPLWNPYNASGEPWLANPQTGVFYPPTWLFLLLPFATAYTIFLLLHLFLLAWSAYLLFARFASAEGALIAAVALTICGPTLSLLDTNLTTFAWLPLILWSALAGVGAPACGAIIALSFLAGEPFYAAVGALMFVILRRRDIVDVALTGFCLSAVQLLPFLAAVGISDRAGGVGREEILRDSMPLTDWLRLAAPAPMAGIPHEQFIPVLYIGLVPCILAVIALVGAIRRRAVHAWLVLLVIAVIVSSGSFFAPVGALLTALPLTLLRYPARVAPLGALAVIALAAIGWDGVARVVRYRWVASALICLVIIDLVPRIAPLLESAPFDTNVVPYNRAIGRDAKIARLQPRRQSFDRRAWIAGYLNLFDRRFDAWTAAPWIARSYAAAYAAALERRDQLDAMSIGYILANRRIPSLPPVARADGVIAHQNRQAWPMAYWRGGGGRMAPVSMLAFTTSAAHVTVNAVAEGEVVLTQQDAPGWQITVDGKPAQASPQETFRAVHVAAGHHEVSWRYRPPLFFLGAALSALGFLRLILSNRFVKTPSHKKYFF